MAMEDRISASHCSMVSFRADGPAKISYWLKMPQRFLDFLRILVIHGPELLAISC